MNNALGLNMYAVGAEHVEPVVKLVGKRLMAAMNDDLIIDKMISPDFTRPAGMLLEVARVAKVGRDAVASNEVTTTAKVGRGVDAGNDTVIQAPKFGLN